MMHLANLSIATAHTPTDFIWHIRRLMCWREGWKRQKDSEELRHRRAQFMLAWICKRGQRDSRWSYICSAGPPAKVLGRKLCVLQRNRKEEDMTLLEKGDIKAAQGWCTRAWAVKWRARLLRCNHFQLNVTLIPPPWNSIATSSLVYGHTLYKQAELIYNIGQGKHKNVTFSAQ